MNPYFKSKCQVHPKFKIFISDNTSVIFFGLHKDLTAFNYCNNINIVYY